MMRQHIEVNMWFVLHVFNTIHHWVIDPLQSYYSTRFYCSSDILSWKLSTAAAPPHFKDIRRRSYILSSAATMRNIHIPLIRVNKLFLHDERKQNPNGQDFILYLLRTVYFCHKTCVCVCYVERTLRTDGRNLYVLIYKIDDVLG